MRVYRPLLHPGPGTEAVLAAPEPPRRKGSKSQDFLSFCEVRPPSCFLLRYTHPIAKKTAQPKPIVIFCHGFKGFKDWGHFNYLGERFAEENCVFVKFNFSHNGTTVEDPLNFGDLEAFGQNNFTKELFDLQAVVDSLTSNEELKSEIDISRMGLLGHSRGGAISIIYASEDKRITKLATWAAVSDIVNRNKKRTIETWQRDGVVFAKNARTNQNMPLYYQFYEDQQQNGERLNVNHAVKKLQIPFLIVHGTAGFAVKYTDALEVKRSSSQVILLTIDGGDHTFGVKHRFEGIELPVHAEDVVQKTLYFFKS